MASAAPTTATLANGGVLDARRCVYLPVSQTLVVADLHLGYAWSRRIRGALLPIGTPEDTVSRLTALLDAYPPRRLVVLGDIVHEALDLPALRQLLGELCERLAPRAELVFCLGNHDRNLEQRMREWHLPALCRQQVTFDGHRMLHGDESHPGVDSAALTLLSDDEAPAIIGHEHPALTLGDGVASRVKCPAFLVSDELIVLPAFSSWAAGCEFGRQPFLGSLARSARFHTAYVCAGSRLLPVPLRGKPTGGRRE